MPSGCLLKNPPAPESESRALPGKLDEIIEEFVSTPREFRLEVLLEYANRLPPLPPAYAEHRDKLERVEECQTPFFVAVEPKDGGLQLIFDAPPESPTVRGFAGILNEGLSGSTSEEILSVPADLGSKLKLGDLVSPLRMRGMTAIIMRLKRLAANKPAAGPNAGENAQSH